jgi:hypothetical protein
MERRAGINRPSAYKKRRRREEEDILGKSVPGFEPGTGSFTFI